MTESAEKIISSRMEEYLNNEIPYQDLRSHMEKLFFEVSIIAVTGHEKGTFPYDLSDGLYRLRDIIDILTLPR